MTEQEIYDAYRQVNRIFYSWRNIMRRWFRFIAMQSLQESHPRFLLKLVITTFVYFKLSIFQRHHAQHRVFPALKSREEKRGQMPAAEAMPVYGM